MLLQSTLALFHVALAVGLPLLASEPGNDNTLDREVRPIVKRGDDLEGHPEGEHQPPKTPAEPPTYIWDDPAHRPNWRSLTPSEFSLWWTCTNEKASILGRSFTNISADSW